jgi:hypothetical protein
MFRPGGTSIVTLPFGDIELLGSLVWVASIAILGLAFFDLLGIANGRTPLGRLEERRRRRMIAFVLIELWLGFLGTAMFFVWGQYQIFGHAHRGLALDFLVIMAALVVGAVVAAHWALPAAVGVLWYLALRVANAVLAVAAALVRIVVVILVFATVVGIRLVELGGTVGRIGWNAAASGGRVGPVIWREESELRESQSANGDVEFVRNSIEERREV